MKQLPIIWQRFVTPEGDTCERCGGTQDTLQKAVAKLAQALLPLDMEPTLETRQLSADEFRAAPVESNRIWIAGKPLEAWLGASSGQSVCCNACEGQQCRTVELNGQSFETIPEELIIQAAMLAAAQMLAPSAASCCDCAKIAGCQ